MLKGKKFDASALRNLLLFIYLNLCSTKYSLGVVKYNRYITKYKLGEAVCSRLLQVSIYSIRGYTLRRAKLYNQKKELKYIVLNFRKWRS